MNTIPWDLRFGLAPNPARGAYLPPLPLPPRRRKERPVYETNPSPAAMQHRTRTILRLALLLLFLALLVGMGLLMHVPQPTLDLFGLRQSLKSPFPFSLDKVVHFGTYFLLSALLSAWMWVGRVPVLKQVVLILIVFAAYSALEEYTQQFTERTTDLHDWYADLLGVTLGGMLTWGLFSFAPRWLTVTDEQPARVKSTAR
jgi:VanZ family protein